MRLSDALIATASQWSVFFFSLDEITGHYFPSMCIESPGYSLFIIFFFQKLRQDISYLPICYCCFLLIQNYQVVTMSRKAYLGHCSLSKWKVTAVHESHSKFSNIKSKPTILFVSPFRTFLSIFLMNDIVYYHMMKVHAIVSHWCTHVKLILFSFNSGICQHCWNINPVQLNRKLVLMVHLVLLWMRVCYISQQIDLYVKAVSFGTKQTKTFNGSIVIYYQQATHAYQTSPWTVAFSWTFSFFSLHLPNAHAFDCIYFGFFSLPNAFRALREN